MTARKTTVENVVGFDEHRTAEQAAQDLRPVVLSEDSIALDFVARHVDQIRFDHSAEQWFVWNGRQWRRDETTVAFSWARAVVQSMARNETSADRRRMGSLKFAQGVEGFARRDQRIAVTRDLWDRDADLFGVPNGMVDLRSGEYIASHAEAYITRSAAVDPDITIDCLRWLRFLNEITDGDGALKLFLQRWIGYSLTGETREQKLAFFHGPGGSGKSTFIQTVQRVLGDYAASAEMATFTNSSFDGHPEQIARLDGVRMVVASETEAGHKLRENRIKELTGGDTITARFMRQNSFSFKPRFKLNFVGNHAPAISHLDTAMQRRILVVPFLHRPTEPDLHLEEILATEWPGILRWAINGAADWYNSSGLIVPKAILAATTEFFDAQDQFGQWLRECCDCDPAEQGFCEATKRLFQSWSAFMQMRREEPGSQTDFNARLRAAGFEPKQIKELGTTGCRGIRLKSATPRHWQEKDD